MQKEKWNSTTLFLVPALGIDISSLDAAMGFIDAYLLDKDHDSYGMPVFLLFRPTCVEILQDFVDEQYQQGNGLIEDYDYAGGYVVLLYQLSEKFSKDYRRFLNGKYSKFSKAFTAMLPEYWHGSSGSEVSLQRQVVDRSPGFVAMMEEFIGCVVTGECWYKPNVSKETLDIDKVRKSLPEIDYYGKSRI